MPQNGSTAKQEIQLSLAEATSVMTDCLVDH
jgi:hypothetical protein